MVVLVESGLNKRHREFNLKVIEAAEKNVNFDDVKVEGAENDIDNLFKIDLASKYKNIDYIIAVLKSGDSLCITRALKCTWVYDSEYSYIINPQFISDEIFPHLSLKFKRKLLTTISIYVRDENRAFEFYKYCNSIKYYDIAFKFLLFANDETKINLLRENPSLIKDRGCSYLKYFIGNSFTLAQLYLEIIDEYLQRNTLHELRYLYSDVDIGVKYLDLFENIEASLGTPNRFGLRMSKDIILKHKDRIYNNPFLYTKLINISMFVKYSTIEDAKFYTTALLPNHASSFWYQNYYESQRHFIDIIPMEEKYQFIKKIFNDKYPGEPFEMSVQFYNLNYHNLIIDLDLKEEWALRHVESQKEILGPNRDFLWYRFIKFEKSFDAIKKYIRIAKDPDARAEITNILIESARNDRELETLFIYYYERHVNEDRHRKERFVDAVDGHHNILNFDSNCFTAFDKLYYSLEVYHVLSTYYCKSNYKIIGLIYRIINNLEMPEALINFMDDSVPFYILKCYTSKLIPDNVIVVYNYLMEFYLNKIKTFDSQPYDESVKCSIQKYIHFVLGLMHQYDKPKEEIPPLVMKFVKLDWDEFNFHFYFRMPDPKPLTSNVLLRCLKQDISEFVSKFPLLKEQLGCHKFRLNHVLRKLRVYFSNDIAKKYLRFYEDTLTEPDLGKHAVNVIVFGIIHLAGREYLEEFMTKHAPTDSKIDHVDIDRKLLSIQIALCSYAGYARPPVLLQNMLKYIKGDYTLYCLPLFNMYLANLQPDLCKEFVKSIVDAPLSLQKHGLRLAFKCFSCNDLKKLIAEMWRRTKNVSLRLIIYKALHDKILEVDDDDKLTLFETLNHFTSTVYEEDDSDLFSLITSDRLPQNIICEHLKTVWETFKKLPLKCTFIEYRAKAVQCLDRNLYIIEPKSFIEQIIDEHIEYVFNVDYHADGYKMFKDGGLIRAKWHLTTRYIPYLKDKENLENKLNLTHVITSKCIEMWHKEVNDANVYRNFLGEFINLLITNCHDISSYRHANLLFEQILRDLEAALPIQEIYQTVWMLKLNIAVRSVIVHGNDVKNEHNGVQIVRECAVKLGKIFVALILEFIEKDMFWIMFENDIRTFVTNEAHSIAHHLDGSSFNIDGEDILVLVCNELTEEKRFETFFLASNLLQTNYNCGEYVTDYKYVRHKLYTFEDKQIKCFVYQKFIRKNNTWSSLI